MKKQLVILFFPNTGFDITGVSVDLPLSVLNLAAFLKEYIKVEIIDQRVESNWRERLEEKLKEKPLALGVSSMTCPQILFGLEASMLTRKISPKSKIIWGGVHPTLMPQSTLQSSLIDIVIRDQAELPFKQLILAASRKGWDNLDLSQFPALSYVVDGEYFETPVKKETRNRLNEFPPLPYELLNAGVETYVGSQGRFSNPDTRSLIMISTVGCPERCTYCAMPGMDSTRTQTYEEPKGVVKRVKELINNYGINAISFHDEEFMINTKRVIEIAELLVQETGGRASGFRWWCQARMDTIEKLSNFKGKDYIPLLIESGLESFQPGIESGSNRILELIKKRETREDFIRINKMLSNYPELQPLYNFMVGFPSETVDEMKKTLSLAEQMLDDNPNAMLSAVYILVPYPGTEIYDTAISAGFKPPSTLEEWSQFNRQQLLTPWVANNQEILDLAEFARVTSRLVDGKRLPRRLDHALGGMSGLDESHFKDLSRIVRKAWREGDFSNLEIFNTLGNLFLKLFDVGRKLKLSKAEVGGMGTGVDERAKELFVDTALPLGGDQIKMVDPEYHRAMKYFDKAGGLPNRIINGVSNNAAIQEGSTERYQKGHKKDKFKKNILINAK